MQLLVKLGATVDDSNRRRLTCLVMAVGDDAIVAYLRRGTPELDASCEGVERTAH